MRLQIRNALPHVQHVEAVAHHELVNGRGFVIWWKPYVLPDQIHDVISNL